MPFDIKQTGAAIALDVRATATASLLASGFCGKLEALLPVYARDPEIYGLVLTPHAAEGGDVTDASGQDRVAGARLAWRLECFSKPTVSLIDISVSGYLAGLVLNGTHRAAGENYRFRILPGDLLGASDGGLTHWLAHLPPGIGAYLVSTGRVIGPAEALRYGLVTHLIPAARFGEIAAGLADADPVDPLLDDRHAAPPTGPDDRILDAVIAETFASCRLDDIRARLQTLGARGREAIGQRLLADVDAAAAGGRLGDALAALLAASRTDMRSTLIAGFSSAHRDLPRLDLPTRAEHQALRNR